jgi:hypothetical protein
MEDKREVKINVSIKRTFEREKKPTKWLDKNLATS